MPLRTSEAFVIDVRKMGEADRLVTFFTEDEGKVSGVAASAARSRRRFGGRLERLSRVRVTYFEKEGRDLARIDSCDLLEESFTLHQDLDVAATLSYVAEVVDTFVHEREADAKYFRLLRSVMAAVRAGVDPALLARYFETWTLRLHGLMPDLDRCSACGRSSADSGLRVRTGGMPEALCGGCSRPGARVADENAAGPGRSVKLSRAALGLLDRFRRLAPSDLPGAAPERGTLSEVETFAVAMLTAFVGHEFRSYKFLREIQKVSAP
ncbi:MAG TPA: DNA repair protein RecO [Candidatus Polarisedimenticolia bacterium]